MSERTVYETRQDTCPAEGCGSTSIARWVECFAVFEKGEFQAYLDDGDWQRHPAPVDCFCTRCEHEWRETV